MQTVKHALNLTYKVFHIKYVVIKMVDTFTGVPFIIIVEKRMPHKVNVNILFFYFRLLLNQLNYMFL